MKSGLNPRCDLGDARVDDHRHAELGWETLAGGEEYHLPAVL